jgi:hypothetical protein
MTIMRRSNVWWVGNTPVGWRTQIVLAACVRRDKFKREGTADFHLQKAKKLQF